ncbi:unnamed protein product, partial [Phaeothamnion confervicola]
FQRRPDRPACVRSAASPLGPGAALRRPGGQLSASVTSPTSPAQRALLRPSRARSRTSQLRAFGCPAYVHALTATGCQSSTPRPPRCTLLVGLSDVSRPRVQALQPGDQPTASSSRAFDHWGLQHGRVCAGRAAATTWSRRPRTLTRGSRDCSAGGTSGC